MLFNSLDFAFFLPIVFAIYWLLANKGIKGQNLFLLVSSLFFYGYWDWRFCFLIVTSACIDFFLGLALGKRKDPHQRKLLLYFSLISNLGILGFFKYFNFFIESFAIGFSFLGQNISASSIEIILPVGISFYTFQTLSYTIDIYHKKIKPTQDLISFLAFVSFFPQLVAGPIERAKNLLPQFQNVRVFDPIKARDGLRQILWGLFKKVVIADSCAVIVDHIFAHSLELPASSLLLGAFLFSIQIYCDFSGYSDMAIGIARLFGFDLMKNFAFPYFSRDAGEFWRRWHISLTSWFKDYVYIPLGGSKVNKVKVLRNIFIVFIISGFWHGASWNFVVWGFINALLFVPLFLGNKNRSKLENIGDKPKDLFKDLTSMILTFTLITFTWIFFRADDLGHAFQYFHSLLNASLFSMPIVEKEGAALMTMFLICFMLIIEWLGRKNEYAIEKLLLHNSKKLRWGYYVFMIFVIAMYAETNETPFIYFQF